jgi:hypothetical protein
MLGAHTLDIMHAFAALHWGYVALAVLALALLIASPFLLVLFRSARAIAYTSTDDFRLSNVNMWTEPGHSPAGGSFQMMRLRDGHFVFLSVGISTVKVFTTPDRSDAAQFRELREFPVPSAFDRVQQSPQKRHAEDLVFLGRLRPAIGWPESLSDLVSSVQSVDSSLLLDATPNA